MLAINIDYVIRVIRSGEGIEKLAEEVRRVYLPEDRRRAIERLASRLQTDERLSRNCVLDPVFCERCDEGLLRTFGLMLRKQLIAKRADRLRCGLDPDGSLYAFILMVEHVLKTGLHRIESDCPPGVPQKRWQSLGEALWEGRISDFMDDKWRDEIGKAFSKNSEEWTEWLKSKLSIEDLPIPEEGDPILTPDDWFKEDPFEEQDSDLTNISSARIMMVVLGLMILSHLVYYRFLWKPNSPSSTRAAISSGFDFSGVPHGSPFFRLTPHRGKNSPLLPDKSLRGNADVHMASRPISNRQLENVVFERQGLRESFPDSPATDVSESDADRYIRRMMTFLKRSHLNSLGDEHAGNSEALNFELVRIKPPLAREYLEMTEAASEQALGRYMAEGLFDPLQENDKGVLWLAFRSDYSDLETIQKR